MIQRLKPWYPFFFALLPVMNSLARNPGGSRPDDVALVIGSVLFGCAVLYLLVAAAMRRRSSAPTIPLVVLALILCFYGKVAVGTAARRVGGGLTAGALIFLLLVLAAFLLLWLSRRARYLDVVNTFFTSTGMLMLGWLSLRLAAGQIRSQSAVQHSELAKELAQPVTSRSARAVSSSGPQRDIYLIVMDEYANSAVLKERFHFDNRLFEDSLRQLGFTIPRLVRSNYVHTLLSLPSLLNFSHLSRLAAEVGPRSTDATLPNYMLENNRTVSFLKARGYRFLFFPSKWWPSTHHNRNADWEFEAWDGFSLSRTATNSDLRRSLIRRTGLRLVLKEDAWDAEHVKRTLAALEQVPRWTEPTFVFAHILSPHDPYVFRLDCLTGRAGSIQERVKTQHAYVEQLQCLNSLVLRTVTTILQRSAVPPLILLQGDHGSKMLRYSDEKTVQAVSSAQARERFGAFGAYYLPDGGGRLFTDSITIVNVFQKVLKHYFGAEVEPAPDDLYMSLERAPYDFRKIEPASLSELPSAPPPERGSAIISSSDTGSGVRMNTTR